MFNICSNQLEDERRKWTAAIQNLSKFEQELADVKKKLFAKEQACKRAESALEGYQTTVPKLGIRPLTELGLRFHLSYGGQRMYSILR